MTLSCKECRKYYDSGPDGTLVHTCTKTGFQYRVTQDGEPVPGHNHPGSFLKRDKSTSATKPDTAEQKKPKPKKK